MQYVGIDWAYRRAAWCALGEGGATVGEGVVAAAEDGLARLVVRLGSDVRACVEMMSGAVWVHDRLAAAGWQVEVAHARRVRDVATLACKTDKVDARVLAELCRRDLVPELWVPALPDRELRERLRRRTPGPHARVGDEPQLRAAHAVGPAALTEAVARTRRDDAGSSNAASRWSGGARLPKRST